MLRSYRSINRLFRDLEDESFGLTRGIAGPTVFDSSSYYCDRSQL